MSTELEGIQKETLTPVNFGKHPRATLDFVMMGTHSVVPHAPVLFGPQACPILTDMVGTPWDAASDKIWIQVT